MSDLFQGLGQKRERTEELPSTSTQQQQQFRPSFARNRRGIGMLMGSSVAAKPIAPAAAGTTDGATGAVDLLTQLGLGTSFVQETADKEHLKKLSSSLSLTLHNNSVITSLFSTGAPQYDWLNEPFLAVKSAERPLLVDEKTLGDRLGKLHHPLPTLEESLLASEAPPPPIRLHKTPDELKKERKARSLAKREAHQAKIKEGKVAEEQKLRLRNLETTLKDRSAEDYMGTFALVDQQVRERKTAHNEANFQRHMEALPRQIEKREERLLIKAETNVILNIYRIFPIREKASLGMFVKFANDQRLRGFVCWIDGRDALVVLMGGPNPMRHLDNWLTSRMQWRASAETVCNIVFSTKVVDMDRFSFHEKAGKYGNNRTAADAEGCEALSTEEEHAELQPVYLKELKTIALAEEFFFETMPSKGPWPSLEFLWRTAMLNPPTHE